MLPDVACVCLIVQSVVTWQNNGCIVHVGGDSRYILQEQLLLGDMLRSRYAADDTLRLMWVDTVKAGVQSSGSRPCNTLA